MNLAALLYSQVIGQLECTGRYILYRRIYERPFPLHDCHNSGNTEQRSEPPIAELVKRVIPYIYVIQLLELSSNARDPALDP